jgi:hypothetical protein
VQPYASGLDSVVDPIGRTVRLTDDRWAHIVDGHPYMAPHRADVLRAIENPTERIAQPRPDQDWFYLGNAGPSQWLKVVVAFDENAVGTVRTAFPRRDKP